MGLGVALRYLQEVGLDALHRREMALTERFLSGLRGNEHIRIPGPADAKGRVGVISVDFCGRITPRWRSSWKSDMAS